MSQVTEHNGVRPEDQRRLEDEPVVIEDPFARPAQQKLQVAVGAGVVAALVAHVLWRLKLRRTPPTPTERLTDAAKSFGDASLSFGSRAADRVSDRAGKVGSGLAEVPVAVVDVAEGVHKFWRRWTLRILMLIAAGLGYTAGAAAGRERYDQIVGAAKTVAARPEVETAQHKVQEAVRSGLQ